MGAELFLSGAFIMLLIAAVWFLTRGDRTSLVAGIGTSIIALAIAAYLVRSLTDAGVTITKPAPSVTLSLSPAPKEGAKKEAAKTSLKNKTVVHSGLSPKPRPVIRANTPRVQPALAPAKDEVFYWKHFNRDPFAKTRDEAMRKRAIAFRAMDISERCVAEAMLVTDASGSAGVLENGDTLAYMLSGKAGVHRNVVVDFVRGIQAKTEEWTLECDGKLYRLILPEVCYNWSLATGPGACVEVVFNAPVDGRVRWGVGSINGPLPASDCNAQRQGTGPWLTWDSSKCDWCEPAYGYIRDSLGETAEVPHRFLYDVKQQKQTLRFSKDIWSRVVYLCLEYDGAHSCSVYVAPGMKDGQWQGRSRVSVPDDKWVWNLQNCL